MNPIGLTFTEYKRDFGEQVVLSIEIKRMRYRHAMAYMSERHYDGIKEKIKDDLLSSFWRYIGAA